MGINKDFKEFSGNINFKEKRSKQIFKLFLKGVAFFTIAAISGGISGAYISSKKNSQVIYPGSSMTKADANNEQGNNDITVSRNDVSKVMEKVSPAIVQVHYNGNALSSDKQVERFCNGIIFKPEGYIITSYSNVSGFGVVSVMLPNSDSPVYARVIGYDEETDIAVIKIESKNLPYVKFGDAEKVSMGDFVVAIGNSVNKNNFIGTSSSGIISSVNKNVQIKNSKTGKENYYNLFLTDANINNGNNGGALCNLSGEVIGINYLKFGGFKGNIEGLGFALSISNVSKIIDSITNTGQVAKAQLGISAVTAVFEDKSVKGVYIQEVVPSSGADAAGVKPTDIVIEADGHKITKIEELKSVIEAHKVGDKIQIKVWRNKEIIERDVTLTEQKDNNI